MNKYEGMFLLDHGKVKNDAQKGIDEITQILEKHGARIVRIGKWDERRLAYEINGQKRGTYILCHFEAPFAAIKEIARECRLSEVVSRELVTRIRKDFPEFMTAQELENAYGSRDYRDRSRRTGGGGGGGGGRGGRGEREGGGVATAERRGRGDDSDTDAGSDGDSSNED